MGGEETGRISSLSLMMDPNITNQVFGTRPGPLLDFLKSRRGGRYVDRRAGAINRWFNPAFFLFYNLNALANYRMGFDALWYNYYRFRIRNHAELEDEFGRLFDIVDDGYGNPYFMYRRGRIGSYREWLSWPRPSIARYVSHGVRIYRALRRIWKSRIALVPFVGPGLWENSWQPMGLPAFASLMRRNPDAAGEMIRYYTALSVASVDAYCNAGARVVGLGDDLAYKAGPMVSPSELDRLYGDGYRQITAAAHRYGSRIFLHCCGNTNELVEMFVEWGFDGAHAFEPTAMNDLAEAREKVGDRLCLIGNIDVTRILVDADREEVEDAVEEAIRKSRGGGFILAPTHTHASINVQNVRWMLETAKRHATGESP